jgi:hypothetical protein
LGAYRTNLDPGTVTRSHVVLDLLYVELADMHRITFERAYFGHERKSSLTFHPKGDDSRMFLMFLSGIMADEPPLPPRGPEMSSALMEPIRGTL